MKKFIVSLFVCVAFALGAQAQLSDDGTGSRSSGNLTKTVPLYPGTDSKVVSFTGTATTTNLTTGNGVLNSITLTHCTSSSTAVSIPFTVELYDVATTAAATFGGKKLVSDITMGGMSPTTAWTLTASASSVSPVQVITLAHPVKFSKGITLRFPAAANSASIGVHWTK